LTDHVQGVGLYLVKVTELFKNTEFKILKIIPGVVAVRRVAGIRFAAITPGMIFRILNSVFFK
jgi:hypothetical protein